MIDSYLWLKISIYIGIILLIAVAILLWTYTPQLFDYFNMAFCPH